MYQLHVDIGLLKETKITNVIHTRDFQGYNIYKTYEPSSHQEVVALFFRNT